KAGEQKSPRRLFIRRPFVKLPVGVEQWGYGPDIGWRSLHNLHLEHCRVHFDKETRPPRCVNLFVCGEGGNDCDWGAESGAVGLQPWPSFAGSWATEFHMHRDLVY